MPSKKSAATCDREVSQRRTQGAQLRDLEMLCGKLRAERDEARAECSRKELWINRYAVQLKEARKKIDELRGGTPVSERRARMEAAKAEAMASGRTVAVQ
jgi:hypothetical protein